MLLMNLVRYLTGSGTLAMEASVSNLFSKKINFWLLTAVLLVRAFVKLLYVMESHLMN